MKQYYNELNLYKNNYQLFFLAQDQFGSIIYHTTYSLLWQKYRGDAVLVVFSTFHDEVLNLVKLYDKELKVIVPKLTFLYKNLH